METVTRAYMCWIDLGVDCLHWHLGGAFRGLYWVVMMDAVLVSRGLFRTRFTCGSV